jgi:putative exporter of polyketide antibiotics
MEENRQPSLLKSTMNYGAMLGLVLIIYTLLTWMLDVMTHTSLRYITFLIIIAGIVLATKTFRDQEQDGSITYGRALGVGTLTVLFAGVIVSFFTYVLYAVIDPGLIEKTYLLMEEQYYDAGMSDAQIEMAMTMAKRFSNPAMISILGLIGYGLMGFIFSLVTSIFLKKEGDPFGS